MNAWINVRIFTVILTDNSKYFVTSPSKRSSVTSMNKLQRTVDEVKNVKREKNKLVARSIEFRKKLIRAPSRLCRCSVVRKLDSTLFYDFLFFRRRAIIISVLVFFPSLLCCFVSGRKHESGSSAMHNCFICGWK